MTEYERFLRLGVDGEAIGFAPGEEQGGYFCTPLGARVLGWDAEGVHFCRIDGMGETIFCVNPMPLCGENVRPVARDFRDFLRLLLATGGAAAIAEAGDMTRAQFAAFVQSKTEMENRLRPAVRQALERIAQGLDLSPMDDPYGYIRALQAGFDAGALRFSDEYYDAKGLERPEHGEKQGGRG